MGRTQSSLPNGRGHIPQRTPQANSEIILDPLREVPTAEEILSASEPTIAEELVHSPYDSSSPTAVGDV